MASVSPPSLRPRPKGSRPATAKAFLVLMVLVAAIVAGGCRCLRGPVNASPGLRWWLFSNFGASKVCPEMTKRGMGLRLQGNGPMVGRFFPNNCRLEVNNQSRTMVVHFSGTGYGYTPFSKRVGFTGSGSVEYRPDFYMAQDEIYVWGKVARILRGPEFQLGYVENPIAGAATAMTPLGQVANSFGNQIMGGKLTQGFTVLRSYDTDTTVFDLGIIQPPKRPVTPYDVSDENYVFGNETVEIKWQQRDFLGPFEIVDDDQHLMMKYFVQGPAIDAMVVDRRTGDAWRDAFIQGRPLGPPPGPVLGGGVIPPQREINVNYRLRPGQYYVVLDHTQYAGRAYPGAANPLNPNGGPLVRVSYVAQLGER